MGNRETGFSKTGNCYIYVLYYLILIQSCKLSEAIFLQILMWLSTRLYVFIVKFLIIEAEKIRIGFLEKLL